MRRWKGRRALDCEGLYLIPAAVESHLSLSGRGVTWSDLYSREVSLVATWGTYCSGETPEEAGPAAGAAEGEAMKAWSRVGAALGVFERCYRGESDRPWRHIGSEG